MASPSLTIRIGADASGATREINHVTQNIQTLGSQVNNTTNNVNNYNTVINHTANNWGNNLRHNFKISPFAANGCLSCLCGDQG